MCGVAAAACRAQAHKRVSSRQAAAPAAAAQVETFGESPQYDDNGDAIGHPFPIPQGGDGAFGAVIYLDDRPKR